MDDALKTRTIIIIYLNVETWLLFAPLSKFLATRLPQLCLSSSGLSECAKWGGIFSFRTFKNLWDFLYDCIFIMITR